MTIKFNDEHIPDSPFRVPVLPSSGDARNVTVEALKQKGLEVSLVRMDCALSLHHESSVLSCHFQDAEKSQLPAANGSCYTYHRDGLRRFVPLHDSLFRRPISICIRRLFDLWASVFGNVYI